MNTGKSETEQQINNCALNIINATVDKIKHHLETNSIKFTHHADEHGFKFKCWFGDELVTINRINTTILPRDKI